MRVRTPDLLRFAALALVAAFAVPAIAADDEEAPPTAFEYAFSADLIGAGFFNSNAYFGNDVGFLGGSVDQWQEFGFEPKLTFKAPLGKGTLFGAVSLAATATVGDDASGLTLGAGDTADVTLEQGNIGWTAKDVLGILDNETFKVTVGSLDYSIGTGVIVNDGGSDGAERGGWYLSVRKTFQEALLMQVMNGSDKLELFRLKNRPRAGGTQGEIYGVNAEHKFGGDYTVGGSYLSADTNVNPVNRLDVFSGRIGRAPESGFGFNAELVTESNDLIDANGWYAQLSWAAAESPWSPVFSFRLADFSGDDPLTPKDERFREIAYGFTDYGSWFQGEITGNYPLGNGNLESDLFRVKLAPREDLTLNVLLYKFTFNEPASFGLTSSDWGDELDLTADWQFNDKLYLIGVLGYLAPGQAAVQMTGGDGNWVYTMIYASYAF